ncbi:MAG: BACON domain-containing protein [Bacteroidales bacterium]|nr:BACON domain-containing protein [Bacteroidales bacterium]
MKTTTFLKSLTLAAAAFFFGACQQYYIETQPEVAVKMDTDVREAYTISGTNPQPATFSIASTTPWEITGYESAEWLSVKPASSALSSLSTDVTLTAVPNDTYEDRSVTLTLKGEGIEKTWTVVVTQSMKSKLYVQPIGEAFVADVSSRTFTIETNLAWEVRSADSWLTFDKTSGTGTGAVETVTATASINPGVERTTTVIVTAGNETKTFEVSQKGITLEFLPVESAVLNYAGGELVLDVDASIGWNVQSKADWVTVEKINDTQVKVTAVANNKFAERKTLVTLVPEASGLDLKDEIELTQDVAFELEGCEVLEDGSVKLDGAAGSRVNIKDGLRYFKAVLNVKEISFGEKGQFWFFSETDGDFGNWMTVGKFRLRTNNGSVSNYDNTYYDDDMSVEFLNTMTTYEFTVTPDAETEGNGKFIFTVNDTTIESHSWASPFAGTDAAFEWYFGFNSSTSDGTYYVVESCTITPIAE